MWGGNHPHDLSNTFFFYLNGWRGINIDAGPGSMDEFLKKRPQDINLEVAISNEPGTLTYYSLGKNDPLNSFSKESLKDRNALHLVQAEIPIQCVPLEEVLDQHFPKDASFDFLSIDVERLDLEVLHSNNWNKYRPDVIIVERSFVRTLEAVIQDDVSLFLKNKGYEVCAKTFVGEM